ncbi:transmembrane protein 230 isoform X2 [Leguminivora glycinivorella]|uniref:transmembrane protein 230 isoform X2 n=1 Tax=Leguminivora glycinivorella TaxID=1035111 RepID=UPI00200FB222|nr:transmembrane protein 230 isoform X2 [Leguminivora glycinivorella]
MKEHIFQFKMSRFRARRQNNGYFQVPSDDSGFSDAQFEIPPPKVPWKAITLATFLFVVGSILLLVGSLIVTGHIDTKYSDRLWPMIVLGGIMFLPGIYHIRIAYYAYKEYPGYSFSDIPEFE